MADLANRNFIKYSPSLESKPPNEDADIQEAANLINTMQRAQYDQHRHMFTGTHARTHAIVKGKLIVKDDIPQYLKQGEIFGKGGEYPIAARYSTEPGNPGQDDRIPNPRGFAMKVFNVQGDHFEAGADIPTQDIEFNSTPALDLADAKTTKEILGLRVQYGNNPTELYKHLEARKDTALQKGRDQVHNTHLSSNNYYGQTAYRYGDYVMKYRMVPATGLQQSKYNETTLASHGSDIFHRWLKDFHGNNEAKYDFQVQLLENVDEQPIEYAGTEWDTEKYPYQTVAQIVFPPQDSFKPDRLAFWQDHIRVDPWHGLKAYQPLGSPNRLRRVVYPASAQLRRQMNHKEEINVKSIDEIP